MIDPDDKNTRKLDLPEPAERVTNNNNVTSIVEPRLEERAIEIGLVRERRPVFVFDASEAKKRGGSAERMAKLRIKQSEAGLRPAAVPAALLEQVKEAGGWEAWEAKKKTLAPLIVEKIIEVPGPERIVHVEVPGPERVVNVEVERRVEVQVPVPIKMDVRDTESLNLGRSMQKLTGWKATLMKWLLKT